MDRWYASIYTALIMAGMVTFIIGAFSNGIVSVGSNLAGYTATSLGILTLLFTTLFGLERQQQQQQQSMRSVIWRTVPFIVMLFVLAMLMYLTITFKDVIVKGEVSPYYYSFSTITTMLLLLQLYLSYTNMSIDTNTETRLGSRVVYSLLYLLSALTFISGFIVFISLKYFTI